jgi:hypothetical protein
VLRVATGVSWISQDRSFSCSGSTRKSQNGFVFFGMPKNWTSSSHSKSKVRSAGDDQHAVVILQYGLDRGHYVSVSHLITQTHEGSDERMVGSSIWLAMSASGLRTSMRSSIGPPLCRSQTRNYGTPGPVPRTSLGRSTITSRALPTKRVSIRRRVIRVSTPPSLK